MSSGVPSHPALGSPHTQGSLSRSDGERPTPNEKKKEKGMKRGGNRFEPYASPAKRYRAFITNIPFDVKWQSLKDLVKEKGKVQLGGPGCPVALAAAQPLQRPQEFGKALPEASLGVAQARCLAAFQGTPPVEPLARSCWSLIPGSAVFSLGIQPQACSRF